MVSICFSWADTWLSRAIRWFTHSQISHVAISYHDSNVGETMIVEAGLNGLEVVPWSRWIEENHLVHKFDVAVPVESQLEALNKLLGKLGSLYDYPYLLGLLVRRNLWRYPRYLSRVTKLICTEAVGFFLLHSGVSIPDPSLLTPQELLEHVLRYPDVFKQSNNT